MIVLIPLAAVVVKATEASFWHAVTSPRALAALELSVGVVAGGGRGQCGRRDADRVGAGARPLPGRGVVNALVDLPFALPTIVAGLTLLAL